MAGDRDPGSPVIKSKNNSPILPDSIAIFSSPLFHEANTKIELVWPDLTTILHIEFIPTPLIDHLHHCVDIG